ncbi:hypothetical protein [Streptomyces marincola]|uniref:hypothetical protein n=1 Tax=Streptomyces marincola TaxID=2878388 RepID=UPI001CF5EA0A|nr:hypothetical protein [Streptomyces marincola]UCM88014.1 hypothetical protein LC193_08620 [Streptomyces marincola]
MDSLVSDAYAQWLGAALTSPFAVSSAPVRVRCGTVFDAVSCTRDLAERALRLLELREAVRGPAVVFPLLGRAAVLVPAGTKASWERLLANAGWPPRHLPPVCLGATDTLRMPAVARAPARSATGATVRADTFVAWLCEPQVHGAPPPLTSAVALARCLTEALATQHAQEKEPR